MIEGLPKLYAELADVVGLGAALKLAEQCGGRRVYLPRAPEGDHWLNRLLGHDAARKICGLYGGEHITFPSDPRGGLQGMRKRAEQALDMGASANEAARASGLHVRSIYARRAKRRERGKIPDLFSQLGVTGVSVTKADENADKS